MPYRYTDGEASKEKVGGEEDCLHGRVVVEEYLLFLLLLSDLCCFCRIVMIGKVDAEGWRVETQ